MYSNTFQGNKMNKAHQQMNKIQQTKKILEYQILVKHHRVKLDVNPALYLMASKVLRLIQSVYLSINVIW